MGRERRLSGHVYARDHVNDPNRSPIRWVMSQWLAALVCLTVSAVALYGFLEEKPQQSLDLLQQFDAMANLTVAPARRAVASHPEGLAWLTPKQDRLQLANTALTTRHVVHEQIQVRRDNRPFLQIKPYLRIAARLAPAGPKFADIIPSFNPMRLYAPIDGKTGANRASDTGYGVIETTIADLPAQSLPTNDRQSIQPFEVAQIVRAMIESDPGLPGVRFGLEQQLIDGLTPAYLGGDGPDGGAHSQRRYNVTTLLRSVQDQNQAIDTGKRETRVVAAIQGDDLAGLLLRSGVPLETARSVAQAAAPYISGNRLRPGQQVHILEAVDDPLGPLKISVFDEAHAHRVTVKRRRSGAFVAQEDPDQDVLISLMKENGDRRTNASRYASIYATGLAQGLQPDQIMQILRIHAYDTDYRRQIRPGDALELFLELETNDDGDLVPGEIIYTALQTGGEKRAFWRFRSQDGVVDFFNEQGQNNRKFLLRKPVRGNNVRLTSGFGLRYHPILKRRRMHNGIDWAAPTGTPIIAAGNGVVDMARRYGANGNYVRIKHPNGYVTTYSHMHRFGPGIRKGVKVRQGKLIGYVGTTGLSTGAHLHFEVRVNGRRVDPLKIQVPRERSLKDTELAEFQRERNRIMTVMRSPPVQVAER